MPPATAEGDFGTGAEAELNLDAAALATRQAAYDLLSSRQVTVRLGELGPGTASPPGIVPVTHPYVDGSEAPLQARPGQTVRLTVLMAPGGSAHATCGLFRRVRTSLARDWIAPGLKQLMPTFRVGPVLVDPAAVRVPKTTGLPQGPGLHCPPGSGELARRPPFRPRPRTRCCPSLRPWCATATSAPPCRMPRTLPRASNPVRRAAGGSQNLSC